MKYLGNPDTLVKEISDAINRDILDILARWKKQNIEPPAIKTIKETFHFMKNKVIRLHLSD